MPQEATPLQLLVMCVVTLPGGLLGSCTFQDHFRAIHRAARCTDPAAAVHSAVYRNGAPCRRALQQP